MSLYARTASLWAHLTAIRDTLINPDYQEYTDVCLHLLLLPYLTIIVFLL